MKKTKAYIFLLFLSPLLFWAFLAHANQGFTIFPAKLSFTIDKGAEQSSWIRVTNAGDDKVGVLVSAQDMVPTAGSSGFNYVPKAPGITSLVDWINIKKDVFILKPNESKEVPFTIKVPTDASPGSRFAIVFFATGAPPSKEGGSQLNVSARVGSLVFVTVPGDFRQTGEISNFRLNRRFFYQKEPIVFKFDFNNTGTVFFEPKGTIDITNIFGKKVAEILVAGNVVLPTGLRTIDAQWPNPDWLFGIYKAHLAINVTGKGDIATQDATFYALPLYPSLGAVGVIIILIMAFWYIKKNFKFTIAKKESNSPENPENKKL